MAGVLLGTAAGDALGLPREGLSRRRGRRLFGGLPLGHRFLFGRGMVSDPTEPTCMTGQAVEAGGDTDTIASITGQVAGAWVGFRGIPPELVRRVPAAEEVLDTARAFTQTVLGEGRVG